MTKLRSYACMNGGIQHELCSGKAVVKQSFGRTLSDVCECSCHEPAQCVCGRLAESISARTGEPVCEAHIE